MRRNEKCETLTLMQMRRNAKCGGVMRWRKSINREE